MFERVWEGELAGFHKQQETIGRQAEERKKKIKQLTDAASGTRSLKVREAYEAQIEEMLTEDAPSLDANQKIDLTIPYRTALNKATTMLKNPHSIWQKVSVVEKHRLYHFIFDKRIGYSKESGYRTAEAVPFSSLFQGFIKQNTAPCDAVPCMVDRNGNLRRFAPTKGLPPSRELSLVKVGNFRFPIPSLFALHHRHARKNPDCAGVFSWWTVTGSNR